MKTLCIFLIFLCAKPLLSEEFTKSYDFNYIREFDYIGSGKIEIKQTGRNRLTLTAEKALIDNTLFSEKGGVLSLAPKDPFLMGRFPGIIQGILEVKDLAKITTNGSVMIDIDSFKADELIIEMLAEGSSLIEGFLDLEKLSLKIDGSAEAVIRGNANTQSIFITGAGTFAGENFTTSTSTIHIQGAGTAFVNATESLTAHIIGYGHVHYVGNPKVYERIMGEGKVSPYIKGMNR